MPKKTKEELKKAHNEANRKWRLTHKNYFKEYNKEHKEKLGEYYKKYRETHRKEVRESSRNWKNNHKKEHKDGIRKWRKNHPNYYKIYRAKNPKKYQIHKLVRNNPLKYPLAIKCIFCGDTSKLEHAHLDYEDEGQNYVTSCVPCHRAMDFRLN